MIAFLGSMKKRFTDDLKEKKRILIIEDDKGLGPSLKSYLEREGLKTYLVSSLKEAREYLEDDAKAISTSLIILDWMLPDGQGLDFLKELRAEQFSRPIIMLTARTDLIDVVLGLESGADDYLTKPFEPRELLARIRVRLKREEMTLRMSHSVGSGDNLNIEDDETKMTQGDISLDLMKREVLLGEEQIALTKMEFDLLHLFMGRPSKAFSRDEILNKVWGLDSYPTTRTVDNHVLQLRQKFSDGLIETIRGVGYRFNEKAATLHETNHH